MTRVLIPWSAEEDERIRTTASMPIEEVVKLFPERSKGAIIRRRMSLGIKSINPALWSQEDDLLIERTLNQPFREVAKLFPNRSPSAVAMRRSKIRDGGTVTWTDEEIEILHRTAHMHPTEAARYLPRHTPYTILYRRRLYHLSSSPKKWNEEDELKLDEMKEDGATLEEMAVELNRPIKSIEKKLNSKKFKLTGTICWSCRNARAGRCSWFTRYEPVEGWEATPTILNGYLDSYHVTKCPNFKEDERT